MTKPKKKPSKEQLEKFRLSAEEAVREAELHSSDEVQQYIKKHAKRLQNLVREADGSNLNRPPEPDYD